MIYEAWKGLVQVKLEPGPLLQSRFEYLMIIKPVDELQDIYRGTLLYLLC